MADCAEDKVEEKVPGHGHVEAVGDGDTRSVNWVRR